MTRTVLAILGLLAFAATAAAEYDPDKEPCPPDMVCTTSSGDEPTYDGNCGGEVCATQDPDRPVSSDDPDAGSSCMDGAEGDEVCRDDVQYLDGREPAPTTERDTAPEVERAETAREVSAGAVILAIAAVAPAAFLVRRR